MCYIDHLESTPGKTIGQSPKEGCEVVSTFKSDPRVLLLQQGRLLRKTHCLNNVEEFSVVMLMVFRFIGFPRPGE